MSGIGFATAAGGLALTQLAGYVPASRYPSRMALPIQASPNTALAIRGLVKRYENVVAVAGIDLDVNRGECFGLLGPNGAGKTTTIEICEGMTEPTEGSVQVLGLSFSTHAKQIRERIGVSLQETQLAEKLTVRETVRLFRSFYRNGSPVDDVIRAVQLTEKQDARVGTLSGGQKQRLAIACGLVGDPDLFFLDEPTTGLDPQSRRQLWELIEGFKAAGKTVLLTTHYMDEAQRLCDRVAIIDHGRVIALGTPRELIALIKGQHVVQFGVNGAGSLKSEDLLGIEGVIQCREHAGKFQLEVAEAHQTIPALLEFLEGQGHELTELSTHSATLEDVFVHLTGRQLRDV